MSNKLGVNLKFLNCIVMVVLTFLISASIVFASNPDEMTKVRIEINSLLDYQHSKSGKYKTIIAKHLDTLAKENETHVWVRKGRPLTMKEHMAIIDEELSGATCSRNFTQAQVFQDVVHFSGSEKHFDNCDFSGGANYIQEKLTQIDALVKNKSIKHAQFTAGQIIHGIQDFYAHSNYLELMELEGNGKSYSDFGQVPIFELWRPIAVDELVVYQAKETSLVSGTWILSAPKRCDKNALSHHDLAKDTVDTDRSLEETRWVNSQTSAKITRYQAAHALIEKATKSFLTYAFTKWPELQKGCGDTIVYKNVTELREEKID